MSPMRSSRAIRADRKFNRPLHAAPPAPPAPAAPAGPAAPRALARRPRPPARPAARRHAGARSGQAPPAGGQISKGILHAFQRGFYTLKGVRDTFAARTSPTSLRTTARLRQPNRTLLGEHAPGQSVVGRPRASDGG